MRTLTIVIIWAITLLGIGYGIYLDIKTEYDLSEQGNGAGNGEENKDNGGENE